MNDHFRVLIIMLMILHIVYFMRYRILEHTNHIQNDFLVFLLTWCFWCVCVCPQSTLEAYQCGSDHTPSPIASSVAVEAEPILDSPTARLTAVAISIKADHTIAFLGDSKGNLHKVTFFFLLLY